MTGVSSSERPLGPGALCVGRELEQSRLRRHLEAARAGTGGVVVIEGVAGVGKTTLANWCLAWARRAGGSTHQVGALGPELELPVGIWARLAASAAVAGHDVPSVLLNGAVEDLHPHDRYGAVTELLQALAPPPVVLVIDDLHRADESSLMLLAQVAPTLPSIGALIVATSRGTSTHPSPAGRDSLDALSRWSPTVAVTEFDGAGVRALALAAAGPDAVEWARAVQPMLSRRSGGNPLVLRTILDELGVADGARPTPSQLASLPIDSAVGTVLARRLSGLPPSSIEVLHAAAMIGGEVSVDTLAEVMDREVDDDIDRAVAVGALTESADGLARFAHAAVAEAVAARAPVDPAALHRRIADALRRRGRPQDLPVIAHHLAAAARIVPPEELAAAGIEAGLQALRVGDHAAAARSFDLAVRSGVAEDVVDLLLRSATAHHLAGHRVDAWERARQAADRCGDDRPAELARAALSYAVGRDYSTDTADVIDLLRRALRLLGPDHELRHDVLAALSLLEMSLPIQGAPQPLPGTDEGLPAGARNAIAWHWVTRPEIARPLADEALALARSTGDDEVVARVAMAWRQSYCAPEHLADRLAVTNHAMAHARKPEYRVLAVIAAVLDHLEDGRRSIVDDALAELRQLGETTGDPAVRWRTGQLAAMVAFASGRPRDAERLSEEAFVHGVQAGEDGRFVVRGIQTAMLAFEVDEDPDPVLDHVAANMEELAYPPIRAGAVAALADAGHRARAMRFLPDLVAHVTEDPAREASWLLTAAFTADAAASLGAVELGKRLLPVLVPFADRIAVDGLGIHCHGSLARPLARIAHLIGDDGRARELITLAREREEAAGLHRFVLDGALDALAMVPEGGLARDGARAEAIAIADEAESLGLTRTSRRARDRLARGDAAQLTARQYDVLLALADGLTYQAAGERLGFSHSTIRHEAMRLYALLGAHDRVEAVRLARTRGMIPRPPR